MNLLTSSRDFAATPQQVWAAFADPQRLMRWWGPDGFSNRFDEFEFALGGSWVFDMIGPDGRVYPNRSRFRDLQAGRQIVIDHICEPLFTLTVTLEAISSGTHLTWNQRFDNADLFQAILPIIEPANEQNLDRLQSELARAGDR